jgi:NIPSNAP
VTTGCCPVVELRQYTLRPGQRDVLVELFDRALADPQEAVGMEIIGQFRDVDRDDRFVWLRGFPDMERRRQALEAFYGGPVWKAHREAANATMLDVDDVLLLRPVVPSSGFAALPPRPRPAEAAPAEMLVATVCSLGAPADVAELERVLLPRLAAATPPALATFVEEPSENTFPALPVRTGEHVVVWIQRSDRESLGATIRGSAQLAHAALPVIVGEPEHLRLDPTPRSRLR